MPCVPSGSNNRRRRNWNSIVLFRPNTDLESLSVYTSYAVLYGDPNSKMERHCL
jgi:hypothetical protein